MKPKASTATLAVVGLVGAAGVAGALFATGRAPSSSPDAAAGAARSGTEATPGLVPNSRPGRLPSIAIAETAGDGRPPMLVPGAAGAAGSPRSQPAEPTVEALAARLAELEARLAAVAPPSAGAWSSAPALASLPALAALGSMPPSKPPPKLLPGAGPNGAPILYAPGPPWPFNTGLRGADPPAVPGAGCLTCEAGAASPR